MGNRIHRPDIMEIRTAGLIIELAEGQTFYETDAAHEIWNEVQLPHLVWRIPKKRVLWVFLKE